MKVDKIYQNYDSQRNYSQQNCARRYVSFAGKKPIKPLSDRIMDMFRFKTYIITIYTCQP